MTSAMTSARAHGKAILLGEHAVVYGYPALAVGLDKGARAFARPLESGPSELYVRGWEIRVRADEHEKDLARAFAAVLRAMQDDEATRRRVGKGPWLVEAESDLWPGGGLGCSAAIGVAIARALDPALGDDALASRAMAWEQIFHGNPSGVDAAVSTRGGCVLFERGQPIQSVTLGGPLLLCIGHSGAASSTKTMVDAVRSHYEKKRELVEKTFDAIGTLVKNARLAIEAGDRAALGKLMDLNQMLLSGLFVSCPEIERMCELARGEGALGAKLTGAGGGGSVIALVPSADVADRVLLAWKQDGFEGFVTRVQTAEAARPILHDANP